MITKLQNPIDKFAKPFQIDNFQFSPTAFRALTSLKPNSDADFAQWQRIGEFIRLTNSASQWWWGDWLNIGEDSFGERSSQALEITRWDEETLRVYSWVCKQVPATERVAGVSFSHYLLLAKLPPAQQSKWANKVVEEQWSQRQLRKALRASNKDAVAMQQCVLVRCNNSADVVDTIEWATNLELDWEECERTKK